MKISYECSEIIEELKKDVAEFGENATAYGVFVKRKVKIPFANESKDIELLVNYLLGEQPPTPDEIEGGRAELSTLGKLLKIFEAENKII